MKRGTGIMSWNVVWVGIRRRGRTLLKTDPVVGGNDKQRPVIQAGLPEMGQQLSQPGIHIANLEQMTLVESAALPRDVVGAPTVWPTKPGTEVLPGYRLFRMGR